MWNLLGMAALAAAAPQAEKVTMLHQPGEPTLSVHHVAGPGKSVLYVHGASFPAALSMNYKLNGKSWADDLHGHGFDVWSFDFAGFGSSDRPAKIATQPGRPVFIPERAPDAAREIERIVRMVMKETGHSQVAIIAHSWGTIPAGLFAGKHPELVDRLVLFGPIAERQGKKEGPSHPTDLVSAANQWDNFQSGVPAGEASPIAKSDFDEWTKAYMATDPASGSRSRPSVEVPSGPDADFADAWSGHLPYDPSLVRSPTLLIRGEWDPIAQDADITWLVEAMTNALGGARSIKLPNGAHRMHLERNRQSLFDAVAAFLGESAR